MEMHPIKLQRNLVIFILAFVFHFLKIGYGSPLFDSDNWLDKLPSFEVKVQTNGISVKSGPSREEIYTIAGYILLGLVFFVVLAITITLCVYKYCCIRGLSPISRHEIPDVASRYNLFPSHHDDRHIPLTNNRFGTSIVGTHLWPSRHDVNGMPQYIAMKTTRTTNDMPVPAQLYRSTN